MVIHGLGTISSLRSGRPTAASEPMDQLLPGREASPSSAPLPVPGPDLSAPRAAIQAIVDSEKALIQSPGPDGLRLQAGCESVFMPQAGAAKGTVLMFHGYTAGPWQYKELAQRFHDAGYNVFVPRMPGHGLMGADGVPTGQKIPSASTHRQWDAFIDQTYALAEKLGAPVQAIGLSGGANVALRMGERHQLAGVGAMAPYLGGDMPKGALFLISDVLDKCTFGLFGRLVLNHIPYNKNVAVPNDPTPHTQGSLGQARSMRRVGADIKSVKCPVQLISTDGDVLSGVSRVRGMLKRCGGALQAGWYRFAQGEEVPHAMLSPQENKNLASVEKVHDMLFEFVDRGQKESR